MEAARRDFAEGVRLFQRTDYEGARSLFKKADGEHHAAAIVYNLAFAEERLSHLQAAVDGYEAYVAEVGDRGEYSAAAGVAIAQIKARATRLRIDTKPSAARVFVDGFPLAEPAPTTFLVPMGHHVVVAQGEGWRAEEDVEARGLGDVLSVVVKSPSTEATAALPPAVVERPPTVDAPPEQPRQEPRPRPSSSAPEGLVYGAAFALAPYILLGASDGTPRRENADTAKQVLAGAIVEVGYALTDRFELLGRGFFALGPDGKPSYAAMGGPGISLRVGSSVWLGATFLGGGIDTMAHDAHYKTNIVFGAMAEATLAVLPSDLGQWSVGFQPGLLLTDNPRDNTAFFFPLTFGFRAY